MKKVLIIACLAIINSSIVFAGSMDELLINGVANNNVSTIQTALNNGANINCINGVHTPLLVAINYKNVAMVNYLLNKGADPNLKVMTWDGRIILPINEAIQNSKIDPSSNKIVQLLVNAGANVNDVNQDGISPLEIATYDPPTPQMVNYLISKGANVNQTNYLGSTALMTNAKRPNLTYTEAKLQIARTLLKAGTDPSVVNNHGKTALQYAIDSNFTEMINLLLPIFPK